METRLVPLLLAAIVVAPAPGAAAQQSPDAGELEMPDGLREVQRAWLDEASRDLDDYLQDRDLAQERVDRLRATLDAAEQAYDGHRHSPVVENLVSLRVMMAYLDAFAEANRTETSEEFVEAFESRTDPAAQEASSRSRDLQDRVNDTQRSIQKARSLEALYVASEQVVSANEQLRLYPQQRSFLEASGNETHPSILRFVVGTSVGANWTTIYAEDLLDHTDRVEEAGTGPDLNATRIPAAQEFVASRVDQRQAQAQGLDQLKQDMQSTADRGNYVLSMAIGGVYIASATQATLQTRMQEDNVSEAQIAEILDRHAHNHTLVETTMEHGYHGILQKDALALGKRTVAADDPGPAALAAAVGQLDKAQVIEQALLPLAEEWDPASEDDEAGVKVMSPSAGVVVAVAGGLALGIGAAALGRRYLT